MSEDVLALCILRQLTAATRRGEIHWNRNEVVDRPLSLGRLRGKIRYTPTFAYRRLFYSPETAGGACSLCSSIRDCQHAIHLPQLPALERFHGLFAVRYNNYPYLDQQIVLVCRSHLYQMTVQHYEVLLEFLPWSGLQVAAVQIGGSGASIPSHAHVNVGGERMPIFDLPRHMCSTRSEVVLSAIPDYPGALYVLAGGRIDHRSRAVVAITRGLMTAGLTYNVYADTNGDIYVLPRAREYAVALGRKIGSMEATGIHIVDALDSQGSDIEVLRRAMWKRWGEISAAQYQQALEQTVCTKRQGQVAEELFASAPDVQQAEKADLVVLRCHPNVGADESNDRETHTHPGDGASGDRQSYCSFADW